MSTPFTPTQYVPSQAATPTLQGEAWKRRFMRTAHTKDCLTQLEGPFESDSVFCTARELQNQEGRKINFHNLSRLGQQQTRGENRLAGNEESIQFGGYQVYIDWRRHAVALTKKLKRFAVGGGTLPEVSADLLGGHFGEWKQRDMLITLRNGRDSRNTIRAGAKADLESLRSADIIDTTELTNSSSQLSINGANPARVRTYGMREVQNVYSYIAFGDQAALQPLKQQSNYLQAVQNGDIRGAGNVQFSGEFRDWDGITIYNFRAVSDDAQAAIGSPLIPRAILGSKSAGSDYAVEAADGDTNVPLFGGGEKAANDTKRPYFVDFLGVPYEFLEEDTPAVEAVDRYLLVYNHIDSPAGSDKGMWGFYRYQGSGISNMGNSILAAERVTATNTNVGNVDFGSGPFNGLIAANHPIGAPVFQANSYGVPIGWTLMLGAKSAVRAYGDTVKYIPDDEDYKFVTSLAYEASFGQAVVQNRRNQPQNYGVIEHAITQQGIPFPTVV